MIIKNAAELATTELRKKALEIIEAGINRVLPQSIMKTALSCDSVNRSLKVNKVTYDISKGRLFVIGGGKAAGRMAETLENIISAENISAGTVNCNSGDYKTTRIEIIEAGHPIPDKKGIRGVEQMLALKSKYLMSRDDLVVCLISGGGSALMPSPVDEVSFEDKQKVTELLLGCGADIYEINAVRKHISKIKGGRFGSFYSPTRVVSLIISDVVGDALDVIASGPTFADSSTFQDAYSVLKKYNLLVKAPESVVMYLKKGREGKVEETPKNLTNCDNHIIGNNRLALEAMSEKAKETGFTPIIVTAEQKGTTDDVARMRASEILKGEYKNSAILVGGETTPELPENAGKGGRNQHYAAASLLEMKTYPGEWVVASVGTDGSDFLRDVAGAIVDNNSLDSAKARGIDVQSYLDRYDSNTLLNEIGGSLVITGETGTNVSDVILYLLK